MANGNMFAGFMNANQARSNALGGAVNALAQGWQNQRDKQAVEAKQQRALGYLVKASELSGQDDAASEQMFMQAYQEDPEFTTQLLQAQKARRESMNAGKPKAMTPYQQESIRLREMEAELKREDNDLRREKLEQDIALQKAKVEKTQQETQIEAEATETSKARATAMAKEARDLAREIANDKGLGSATGSKMYVEYLPTTTSTSDLVNKAFRLQSMLTVDNLNLMTGVLTERDIQFLTAVSSGLDIDPEKRGIIGSEEVVRERLNDIANRIDEKLSGMGSESGDDSDDESKVVMTSDQYGDITEADIQQTMKDNNMTREQVIQRLGGR